MKRPEDTLPDGPLVLSEATPLTDEDISESSRGNVFDVLVIRPGTSKNKRRYSPRVLEESAPLLDGARSFMSDGPDHDPRKRGVGALVGWWTNPRYERKVELPTGKFAEGIVARYHVTNASLAETLRESLTGGKPDLVGFSIVAEGAVAVTREGGSPVIDVKRIDRYESVDPVINAAAGGMAVRLVASTEDAHMQWDTLSLAEAVKGLASGEFTIDEVREHRADLAKSIEDGKVAEAAPQPEPVPVPVEKAEPEKAEAPDVAALVEAQVGPYLTAIVVERVLSEHPRLADITKARIRESVSGKTLSEDEVRKVVQSEVDYLAKFAPAQVTDSGPVTSDHKDGKDRLQEALDAVVAGTSGDSIRELYVTMTGDRQMSGRLSEAHRLSEAIISSTFAQALGDSITRAMVSEYARVGLDTWRPLVDVVPLRDFRTQRRVRMGGYGNLAAVNEAAAYQAASSPTDEEATYAPTKRGNLESVTLETIANDDIGAIRRVPTRFARAAAQTLHEFVFQFLNANPTIYDASALFVAGHNNIGTTALSATTLAAGRLAMLKQAEMDSSKRLGIQPRYLVVPVDLEQTAYELTATDREVGNGNNTLNFARTWGLSVIVVPYWTDANNWYLVADKSSTPTIEVGFLNGREEPELFLADQPTVGSMFTNDQLTWKIRHIYGGAVLDFRGFYGAIVA